MEGWVGVAPRGGVQQSELGTALGHTAQGEMAAELEQLAKTLRDPSTPEGELLSILRSLPVPVTGRVKLAVRRLRDRPGEVGSLATTIFAATLATTATTATT